MTTKISHAAILQAGRYRDLRIEDSETEIARALYRFMLRLRLCEEALAAEYHPADEMRCPVHFCVGQEAIPAAVAHTLRDDDYLFSHHRSHGYYLAKGAPMRALFAELYGKSTGANAGLAGSQDISFPGRLRADPLRIGHPDSHAPMSAALEAIYYPSEADAVSQLRALVR